jgi:hypothetical protein
MPLPYFAWIPDFAGMTMKEQIELLAWIIHEVLIEDRKGTVLTVPFERGHSFPWSRIPDGSLQRAVRDARPITVKMPSFGTVKTVPFRSDKGSS